VAADGKQGGGQADPAQEQRRVRSVVWDVEQFVAGSQQQLERIEPGGGLECR